jgi:radical SAM protein with 4Fe4S-binding SPASM domain
MKLKVSVFEYLNQKVMYIQDVNYYFGIRDNFDIKLGDYELSEEEVLNIAKENDPEEYEIFINTSIEVRLNKIKTYDIEEIKEQSSYGQFTLCLHPSRKCNLNCKYCFRESEYLGEQQLTFEVAKDAIDFLVDKYAPCASKYVVDLSGSGEPLLQIDLIKQIVEYCKKKRNEICKNIEVMFCTNLTLLTPEIVEYLDNEPSIILGTSIDGDQITNDNNRVYANGKGTYADIVKGLKMFKNKKLGLAVTITPLNQDVDLIYDYLYHLPNVDCVSMKFIRCYDGSKYDFDNFDVPYLVSRYEKLCNNILNEVNKGNFDYFRKILKGADMLGNYTRNAVLKNIVSYNRCDAGTKRLMINYEGDVYACSVMANNEHFYLGNIMQKSKEINNSIFLKSNILTSKKCIDCNMRYRCGGECYATSYLKYNNLFTSNPKLCLIKCELLKLSMSLSERIKNSNNKIFGKLINSIFDIQKYCVTDSGIWSVYSYLKTKNKLVVFDEISNSAYVTYSGINPKQILYLLKKHVPNISAYKIEEVSDLSHIKFPAIALITNGKNIDYNYIIIKGIDKNDNINFIQMDSKTSSIVSKYYFVNNISNIIFAEGKNHI